MGIFLFVTSVHFLIFHTLFSLSFLSDTSALLSFISVGINTRQLYGKGGGESRLLQRSLTDMYMGVSTCHPREM